ncbi:MAG: hypothetical protein AAGH88_16180 [Planctomycetota bacterium]
MDPIIPGMILATLASMLQARKTEQRHLEAVALSDYLDTLKRSQKYAQSICLSETFE